MFSALLPGPLPTSNRLILANRFRFRSRYQQRLRYALQVFHFSRRYIYACCEHSTNSLRQELRCNECCGANQLHHVATTAPTTSTTMQLALGDALAVALLERRGFTAEHFRVLHPGGKLGRLSGDGSRDDRRSGRVQVSNDCLIG